MISTLRSNQPIAFFIAPATLICCAALRLVLWPEGWKSIGIQSIGLLLTSWLCHWMYVNRNFVERGDPALAWSITVWGILFMNESAEISEAIRSWGSILLIFGSLALSLSMHRQHSTSGIQFRAGALVGIAIILEPQHWGALPGLMIVQAVVRPFILREWLMLIIGTAWSGVATYAIIESFMAEADWTPLTYETWIHWKTLLWPAAITAFTGLIFLLREQNQQVLRTQNTRLNTLLFVLVLVIGSTVNFFSVNPLEDLFQPPVMSPTIPLALGYMTLGMIPQLTKQNSKQSSLLTGLFWIYVSMLLVLFVMQFLR
ncbi:MAG: DUF6427 family protein [Flavobacteriales bacterium]